MFVKSASSLTLINWLTVNAGFMLSLKIPGLSALVFFLSFDELRMNNLHFIFICFVD